MTGKETLEKYSKSEYNEFVSKGISDDFSKRYKSIEDIYFNRVKIWYNR